MDQTKETKEMRKARVAETANGHLWKTRVVRDRTKYTRKEKHKKTIAERWLSDFWTFLEY